MQAPIEVSRRAVEKCFYLTSSLIGSVKRRFFTNGRPPATVSRLTMDLKAYDKFKK